MKIMRVIWMAGILLLGTGQLPAATWYVAKTGSDTNSGASWATALLTITKGIGKATNAGDVVTVSNGYYREAITIGRGITVQSASGDPADTVICDSTSPNVTLTNANAMLAGFSVASGKHWRVGGIYIYNGGGTVSNCVVRDNTGTTSGNGGIRIEATGGLVIDSSVLNNSGEDEPDCGAGICMLLAGEVRRCLISNNVASNYSATMYGGGMRVVGGLVAECTIANNHALGGSAGWAGGLVLSEGAVVSQCLIRANTAKSTGGGLTAKNCTIVDCTVEDNQAGACGGISVGYSSSLDIQNCLIQGNTSASHGGGLSINDTVGLRVRNCLVQGNSAATFAGGVYIQSSMGLDGYLDGCTIVGNHAGTIGGGLRTTVRTNYVYNTIVASNTADESDPNVYHGGVAGVSNFFFHCCVPDLALPPERGNIQADPGFVQYADADYRLASGSLCMDAGTNRAWMDEATDLLGRPRLNPILRVMDMGAYESAPRISLFRLR